jgi:hypothetical protein
VTRHSWCAPAPRDPAEIPICLKSWRIPVLPGRLLKVRFQWTSEGRDTLDVQDGAELYRIHVNRDPSRWQWGAAPSSP